MWGGRLRRSSWLALPARSVGSQGFGAAALGAAVFTTLCLRRRALADAGNLITSRVATDEAHHRPGEFAFLASGAVWLSFAFFLLTTMAFGILQNYASAILSHVYGVSLIVASGGLTAYLVGSGTGSDRRFYEGSC